MQHECESLVSHGSALAVADGVDDVGQHGGALLVVASHGVRNHVREDQTLRLHIRNLSQEVHHLIHSLPPVLTRIQNHDDVKKDVERPTCSFTVERDKVVGVMEHSINDRHTRHVVVSSKCVVQRCVFILQSEPPEHDVRDDSEAFASDVLVVEVVSDVDDGCNGEISILSVVQTDKNIENVCEGWLATRRRQNDFNHVHKHLSILIIHTFIKEAQNDVDGVIPLVFIIQVENSENNAPEDDASLFIASSLASSVGVHQLRDN